MEYTNNNTNTLASPATRASTDFIIEQPMNVNSMEGYSGDDVMDSEDDDETGRGLVKEEQDEDKPKPRPGKKTRGRVKIKFEYITKRERRFTTFSKRKTGLMKKAYELSALTGTEVMLLVASETGHVYTFATRKLMPIVTSKEGKELIQTCLSSPDPEGESRPGAGPSHSRGSRGSASGNHGNLEGNGKSPASSRGSVVGTGGKHGNSGNHVNLEGNGRSPANGGNHGSSSKGAAHSSNGNYSNAGSLRSMWSSKVCKARSDGCGGGARPDNNTDSDNKVDNVIGISKDSSDRSDVNLNIHELINTLNDHENNVSVPENTHKASRTSVYNVASDVDHLNKAERLVIPSSLYSAIDPAVLSSSLFNKSSDACQELDVATKNSNQIGANKEGMVLFIPQTLKARDDSDVLKTSQRLILDETVDCQSNSRADEALALNLVQPQQQNVVYVNVSDQQQQNVMYVKIRDDETQLQEQQQQQQKQQPDIVYLKLPNQDQLVAVSLEDLQRSGLRILTDAAVERHCQS